MKFVYFGYDFMLPAMRRLLEDGHEMVGIMGFECDNVFNFNHNCRNLAAELKIPFITSKVSQAHIDGFLDDEVELFLSAGYPHKIPPIDSLKAYGVNIHPTYLPHARGMMPIPRIIMEKMEDAAGFTAHKMTESFDAGDILLQHKIELSAKETVESYSAKIAVEAPEFTSKLVNKLTKFWKKAAKQDEAKASYITPPSDEERMLDWTKKAEDIDRTARAFGRFGSIAKIDGALFVVYDHDFWQAKHKHKPGHIAATTSREITIAVKDGYFLIKDFQPIR